MKAKLIQILLGAIGSAITVIVTHLASVPPEIAAGVALSAGPASTALLGNIAEHLTRG